jgi:hypothetical protein
MAWAWKRKGHQDTSHARACISRCVAFAMASSTPLFIGVIDGARSFGKTGSHDRKEQLWNEIPTTHENVT